MSRKVFVLDLGRCVGCGACVLACRLENGWPAGVSWRRLLPLNLGRYSGGPAYHFSLACHHCEQPACLAACPAGAYSKREDGVVLVRADLCLGCRYCEMACPFGAPSYDAESGVVTKCHFCVHRLEVGLQPSCVAACPTGALLCRTSDKLDETDSGQYPVPQLPGFSDPGGCGPNIRFVAPRGRIRGSRFRELQEGLER